MEKQKKKFFDDLTFKLAYGIRVGDDYLTDVTLLETNGIAEKIYRRKSPETPYSWIARALTIAIEEIDGQPIGGEAREAFQRKNTFEINPLIKKLTFADATNAIFEAQRRIWQQEFEHQPCSCVHCGHQQLVTLDLGEVDFITEEISERVAEGYYVGSLTESFAKLTGGMAFKAPKSLSKNSNSDDQFSHLDGAAITGFFFRPVLLQDAIKCEKWFSDDDTEFYRRLAYEALVAMELTDSSGQTHRIEDPKTFAGIRYNMFDVMKRFDLKAIRDAVISQYDAILNPVTFINCESCMKETPVTQEPSSFFGN